MSRTFYTDYVRHALRFYARNNINRPTFKSDADKNNWLSCESVLKRCPVETKEMLITVYSGYDTLADEVYNVSKKLQINQNIIWDAMKDVERKIAHRRGLI